MEEGGEWRRRRRPPHGSTASDERSFIPDWASLPPELVEKIADCVLSTTGRIDAYMDMRAVCPSWRSAVAKISPLAAISDFRFRPRHWLLLDMTSDNHDDDARLFLHVPTGRFRWLRLPALCTHGLFGASDGLLVLPDRVPPHLARVLNPFTGDMLKFDANLPQHVRDYLVYTSVDGGSHLVLLRCGSVVCVSPTSYVFTEMDFTDEDVDTYLVSMVNFQGTVYCADRAGYVYKFVAPVDQPCDDDAIAQVSQPGEDVVQSDEDDSDIPSHLPAEHFDELVVVAQVSPGEDVVCPESDDDSDVSSSEGDDSDVRSYLVDSAGELLLVRYLDRCFRVFRVDIERKLLEKVESIGGGHRALFLGEGRCLSVDVDNLPSVDGDCIYMFDFKYPFGDECEMCVYNLRDGTLDVIPGENYLNRPFSLVQVLLRLVS